MPLKWDRRQQSGSLNMIHGVQRQTVHFSGKELDIVRNYTQINGYFAHEEHVLLYFYVRTEVGVRYVLNNNNNCWYTVKSHKWETRLCLD